MAEPPSEGHERTVTGSLGQGRVELSLGVRLLWHGATAIAAHRAKPRWRHTVMLAASVALDLHLTRRLRDPAHHPGAREVLLESLDAAMWGPDFGPVPLAPGPVLIADAVPSSIIAGYRVAAGQRALPVYDAGLAYPPTDLRSGVRSAAILLAPVIAPFVAVAAARRRKQQPTAPFLLVWPTTGALVTIIGVRHRDRLQTWSREEWERRAAVQVQRERAAARVDAATATNPGHDFKKTLFALGCYGSERAAEAARTAGAHPGHTLAALTGGQTLRSAVGDLRVEPPELGRMWLDEAQVRSVREFLERAEHNAQDGADQVLRVRVVDTRSTELVHLGSRLVLTSQPPPLLGRLYPTSGAFLISIVFIIYNLLPAIREVPRTAILAASAVYAGGAARFWRRPPDDDELGLVVSLASAAFLVGCVASAGPWASTENFEGREAIPISGFARGYLLLLGSHWGRLSPTQRLLFPGALATSAAVTLVRKPDRNLLDLLGSTLDMVSAAAAAWRTTDRLDAEVRFMESELQAGFVDVAERARIGEYAAERRHIAAQLAIAREALADLGDSLPDDARAELTADCDALERWLGAPTESAQQWTAA